MLPAKLDRFFPQFSREIKERGISSRQKRSLVCKVNKWVWNEGRRKHLQEISGTLSISWKERERRREREIFSLFIHIPHAFNRLEPGAQNSILVAYICGKNPSICTLVSCPSQDSIIRMLGWKRQSQGLKQALQYGTLLSKSEILMMAANPILTMVDFQKYLFLKQRDRKANSIGVEGNSPFPFQILCFSGKNCTPPEASNWASP